jgi:Flp pilus assembly pilin Flp
MDGPTAVEYAVLIMLIFLAVILLVQVIGQSTSDSIENSEQAIGDSIDNAWSN